MKFLKRSVAALAAAAAACSTAHAQFADRCGSATTVGEGVYAFDLSNATNDYPGPCGETFSAPDAWVRYVASGNGTATVTTCGHSGSDTVLTVLNGECGAAVLQCNDDACSLQSSMSFPVTAGRVYMVRIAGYGGGLAVGSVSISRPNDRCSDATNVGDGLFPFDTSRADTDGSTTCGFNTQHDVWFRYTARGPGTVTIDTCTGTDFDTVLSAYAGCGAGQLACSDDSGCGPGGLDSVLGVPMSAGQSILVRVAGYNGESGHGNIRFSFDSADSCAHPLDVFDGALVPFDNTQAINDGPGDCSGLNDVWYRFHAPNSLGWLDANTCGLTGLDTVLAVYTSCGGSAVACNDDACSFQSSVSAPMNAGDAVLVSLSGFDGRRGTGQVRFMFRGYDSCANAFPVTDGVYPFDNRGATTDGPTICGLSGNNVWYSYSAEHLGHLNVATCGLTNLDTVLTAFNGCGGAVLACNDDAFCPGNPAGSFISFNVQPGSDTRISLGGYDGFRGSGQVLFEFIPCRIDFNDDGFVDFFDYDDYVNCFETSVCPPGRSADFNNDGFADFFDYDDFVAVFEDGC